MSDGCVKLWIWFSPDFAANHNMPKRVDEKKFVWS